MSGKWVVKLGAGVVAWLLAAPMAWATIGNVKSYKEAYPGKGPKAYSCKTCHEHPVGKSDDLNAYGKALQEPKGVGKAGALTVEDYRAVEAGDADGDGALNGEEIKADTDSSDPASVPEAAPEGAAAPVEGQSRLPAGSAVRAHAEALVPPTAGEDTAAKDTGPAADAAEPAQAEYVGTETCAACHQKEFKEFQHSTHARISIPDDTIKMQGCEMCHGPGSLHAEAGGGRGVGGIINPRKDPSTCFECHTDKKAELRLPHHHPILEGKMSCADCHNAHGEDVRPWSATSLKDINEACFRCHKDQRGPFVWEHEALREGCTTCHKVHGSIHEKMLVARDSTLCLRCHTQVGFPTIGQNSHAGRPPQGTCFSAGCHTAPHGSNFDDHLRY